MVLPGVLTHTWSARRQQIFPAETVAVPIALSLFSHHMCGRDVIAFCDNSAAVSTLIRGTSTSEDCRGLAELTHALMLSLHIRLWIDWVDSQSNPSDGLSRLGMQDPWTQTQKFELMEISGEHFPDLGCEPVHASARLLHWGAVTCVA